jgi:hypothetical protein
MRVRFVGRKVKKVIRVIKVYKDQLVLKEMTARRDLLDFKGL